MLKKQCSVENTDSSNLNRESEHNQQKFKSDSSTKYSIFQETNFSIVQATCNTDEQLKNSSTSNKGTFFNPVFKRDGKNTGLTYPRLNVDEKDLDVGFNENENIITQPLNKTQSEYDNEKDLMNDGKSVNLDHIIAQPRSSRVSAEVAEMELWASKQLIKRIDSWNDLKSSEIIFFRMGGLSNIVYHAKISAKKLKEKNYEFSDVIVKINPISAGNQESKTTEDTIFKPFKDVAEIFLEKNDIGPKNYFRTEMISAESFIDNTELTQKDSMDQKSRIWMMQCLSDLLDTKPNKQDFGNKPFLIYLMDKGQIKYIKRKLETFNLTKEEKNTLKGAQGLLQPKEYKFVYELLNNWDIDDLYLSHNDFYYLNILYNKNKKTLQPIDFEYAGLNPFGSDLINIVNEMAYDYDIDYYPFYKFDPKLIPSDEKVRDMIKALLFFWDNKDIRISADNSEEFFAKYMEHNEAVENIDEQRVEKLYENLLKCNIVTNFFFVVSWTLLDLRKTDIDMILFARDRTISYQLAKKKYFQYMEEKNGWKNWIKENSINGKNWIYDQSVNGKDWIYDKSVNGKDWISKNKPDCSIF